MPASRPILILARPRDAEAISALRCEAAEELTRGFGKGPWSGSGTARGVLWDMRRGRVFVARNGKRIVACLTLSTRKPWAIDTAYFTRRARPLYLTTMAVAPDRQRSGLGRRCLADLDRPFVRGDADSIRLDAFDADAGAGGFYAKCGFSERGRVRYRGVPLVYFERLLEPRTRRRGRARG